MNIRPSCMPYGHRRYPLWEDDTMSRALIKVCKEVVDCLWCGKAVDIRNYPLPEFREISRIESIGMSVVEPCEQPTRLECIANAIRSLWQDHRLLRVCRGRR